MIKNFISSSFMTSAALMRPFPLTNLVHTSFIVVVNKTASQHSYRSAWGAENFPDIVRHSDYVGVSRSLLLDVLKILASFAFLLGSILLTSFKKVSYQRGGCGTGPSIQMYMNPRVGFENLPQRRAVEYDE